MKKHCINKKDALVVKVVLAIWVVLIFMVFVEFRVNATVAKANGELIPIYFKQQEVIYGDNPDGFTDPADFTYEKPMKEFVPVDCNLSTDLQEYTWLLCKANNIDYSLVMALMKHESQYDASVVSTTNDYGLMQINKINHEWLSEELGITDYLDEKQNINAGVYILGNLFEKYQDTSKVLMAYNMGESNAKKLWKDGIYESRYSRKIMQYQAEIREQLEKQN